MPSYHLGFAGRGVVGGESTGVFGSLVYMSTTMFLDFDCSLGYTVNGESLNLGSRPIGALSDCDGLELDLVEFGLELLRGLLSSNSSLVDLWREFGSS